ncbi:carbohydrate kinase [Ascodesmis nigricans]|uniref:Gluconokinase n=1 Tax=Ascodesmis nigricans TaxID=341454 RepID=A0A4S2MTB5_9PEZI|nr:carbohydrate kinase [Ascodesmis nigricans]
MLRYFDKSGSIVSSTTLSHVVHNISYNIHRMAADSHRDEQSLDDLQQAPYEEPQYIFVIAGPSGCGKSSVAKHVAEQLNYTFIEGDDCHSKENKAKMGNGTPLTDEDRKGWLNTLRKEIVTTLETAGTKGCVVTCSALKRQYRNEIRKARKEASKKAGKVILWYIFLEGSQDLLEERVEERGKRENHYMKAKMVASQFKILEMPDESEPDVATIKVDQPLDQVKKAAVQRACAIQDMPLDDALIAQEMALKARAATETS